MAAGQMGGRHFLSDNAAGVHPEVMRALERANRDHAEAYGEDEATARATALLRRHFGDQARPFLLLTGTGANVLALEALLRPYESVVASDASHVWRDECGALAKHTGSTLLPAPSRLGKLRPEDVRALLAGPDLVHRTRPRVLSISQATEWGTVYAAEEVRALADLAHEHGLLLHVDGARLANAAVSLGLTLGEASTDLGVDALSFGGTKNGLLAAEAVVFLSEEGAADFPRVRKQGLQLVSKMRFVAAQFVALLEGDLWRRNAEHANAMASRLAGGARGVGPVEIVAPVESNAVFARIPHSWVEPLGRQAAFHVWDARGPVVRWVTSFDTREEDVDGFVARLAALAESVR